MRRRWTLDEFRAVAEPIRARGGSLTEVALVTGMSRRWAGTLCDRLGIRGEWRRTWTRERALAALEIAASRGSIAAAHVMGVSDAAMRAQFCRHGLSIHAERRRLRELDPTFVTPREPPVAWADEEIRTAIKLVRLGWSVAQIAAELGRTRGSTAEKIVAIRRKLRAAGHPPPVPRGGHPSQWSQP